MLYKSVGLYIHVLAGSTVVVWKAWGMVLRESEKVTEHFRKTSNILVLCKASVFLGWCPPKVCVYVCMCVKLVSER